MNKTLHIKISGHVQGVGFRYNTQKLAGQLNLVGWVRNTQNGEVEILAQGEENSLIKLLDECQTSPSSAKVDKVEHEWINNQSNLKTFEIKD